MHSYVVTARNFATGSTNKIHDDTVAAQYGFGGGLVPGVGLLAYLVHPAVDAFGPGWRAHGRIAARFVVPVYEGEEVLAQLDGRLSAEDARERTVRHTRRFVRRQRSWFRRDPRLHWLDAATPDLVERALTLVR